MSEAFFTIWLIILLFFSGFGGGVNSRRAERPKPSVAALPSPSPSPSVPPGNPNPKDPKNIPTPALLPGLIVLLGKVLQKKGEKVA